MRNSPSCGCEILLCRRRKKAGSFLVEGGVANRRPEIKREMPKQQASPRLLISKECESASLWPLILSKAQREIGDEGILLRLAVKRAG